MNSITQIIRQRRSIFPPTYTDQVIARELIDTILENANFAPTHQLTQPWRFRVITGDKRAPLGELLSGIYKEKAGEQFSEMKYNKMRNQPLRASHIIAICMKRDEANRVPEWEELAAVAMAVQNMWLTATELNIGAFWSSPRVIESPAVKPFLQLGEDETCLGFLYLGYHNAPATEAVRTPIEEKVIWL